VIKKELELKAFEVLYNTPEGFFDNGKVIIDVEITNDLSPDWIYQDGRPCSVGFLFKDNVTIYLAESEQDEEFKSAVKGHLLGLDTSLSMYSFNSRFETGVIQGYFGVDVVISEIKPFFAKFWKRDKFFEELQKEKVIPKFEIVGSLDYEGYKCKEAWIDYLSGNKDALNNLAINSLNSLLKESVLINNNKYFLENYNINSKGWLVGVGRKRRVVEGEVVKIFNEANTSILVIQFTDDNGHEQSIELRSYYKMVAGVPDFSFGSNWIKYKNYYGKEPEVGDKVKVEPNSKHKTYHVLL